MIQAREHCLTLEKLDSQYNSQLEEIQARLIDLGAQVATPRKSGDEQEKKIQHTQFDPKTVADLEKWIDHMDTILPPLKNCFLPSGGLAASQLPLGNEFQTNHFHISPYCLQKS